MSDYSGDFGPNGNSSGTSGTDSYNPVSSQIIRRAGRQVGAWAAGEVPEAQELQDWTDALNAMIKEWQATGLHLWSECEGILFLTPNQIAYPLGPGSQTNATQSYVRTTLTANAGITTSINVASVAGIAAGQTIGIFLSSNVFFWTSIVSVATAGLVNTIVLASPLPSGAYAGMPVYTYTTVLDRPLRILDARRIDVISQIETPIQLLSRLDYRDLPNKWNRGSINAVFYDPQLVNGVLNIWNNPITSNFACTFTWMRQLQDIGAAKNTADFPQEWINCLTWNLAKQMFPEYSANPQRAALISAMAAESMDMCSGWDKEPESIYAGVNFEQSMR